MRHYFIIFALGLISACSSSPEIHSYQLVESKSSQATPTNGQEFLYVEPVQMSPLISGLGLVYQTSETQVVQANNNIWAEDIAYQVRRRITLDLRGLQHNYWPQQLDREPMSLSIHLDKFQGMYTGDSVVSGQWVLKKQGGVVKVQPFSIQVALSSEGGYQAQVEALSQGISLLSQQIAESL